MLFRSLYVTSFRTNSSDNDKVLIFNGKTGAYLDKIDLDQVGQPRAFAQAILFGPGGSLFVPISGNGPDTGEVRRYDVATKNFTVFVAPNAQGGALVQPWYLTFAKTNRSTLAYGEDDGGDGQDSLSSVAGTSNTVQAPVGLAAVLVTAHNTSSSGAGIVSPGQKADSKSSNSTPALTTAGRGVHQSHVNTPARQAAAHDRVFAHSRSNSLHSAMIDDLAMSLVV